MAGARIGVDLTWWSNPRGLGRFTRSLFRHLLLLDDGAIYVPVCRAQDAAGLEAAVGVEPIGVRLRPDGSATPSRGPRELARLTRAVGAGDLDVFVFPSVAGWFPVIGPPTVVGVHDLIASELGGLVFAGRRLRALAWRLKEHVAVRGAARVFTVSQVSRAQVAERFGLDPADMTVVREAPDPAFWPRPRAEVDRRLGELGLSRAGYVVYVGGITPRKNIEVLLDAYTRLARGREVPLLVLVGALDRGAARAFAPRLKERIRQQGLEEHVRLPGFVGDDTLACLYSGALAMVSPSPVEGFGLPAVEAAACGAPTVLSDIPAHRESLGAAGLWFDPRSAAELAGQLARLLEDGEVRSDLGARGRLAVSALSWEGTARAVRGVIAEALG